MQKEETSLRTIRTYKDDIAKALNSKKESVVSIVAAENKRRVKNRKFEKSNDALQKQHLKKVVVIILITTLFVLGAGSAFYFYGKSGAEIVEPVSKIPSIIFSEKEEEFEITNLSRRQILNELVAIKDRAQLSMGGIKNIFITESFIDKEGVVRVGFVSAGDFLNTIDAHLSASFMRSLEPVFMLGVHMFNESQPFLILKTSFYENAFTGMFAWEKEMKEDLAPLFGSASFDTISNEDFGTSSLLVANPTFKDFVVKNKDVRILKNSSGDIVLMYSFIDKNTIVITTNEITFGEILTRLR